MFNSSLTISPNGNAMIYLTIQMSFSYDDVIGILDCVFAIYV